MDVREIHTIDEYIEAQREEIRPRLRRMRELIRQAAPQAEEKISWGMATFTLNGNLVHFSAEKRHMGFHPAASGVEAFKGELEEYRFSKGTIQLPYDKPLPEELIKRIVAFRVKEQIKPREKKMAAPRPRHEMPEDCREALLREGLMENYSLRPPYQQNDYISWITRARRPETRQKRLEQMLSELCSCDRYMGMEYKAKGTPKEWNEMKRKD